VLNDGDIELNTGNGDNPRILLKADRVESSGDVFVQGNSDGLASQLASLTHRLDEVISENNQATANFNAEVADIKRNISHLLQLSGETAVGTVENGKVCKGDSSGSIQCTFDEPSFVDKVNIVTDGKWCTGDAAGKVSCTEDAPLLSFTESDPKVGTLTNSKWCTADSGQVSCTEDAPLLSFSESDPKVGTLTNSKWCTADSGQVSCTEDAPLLSFTESDPSVGALEEDKWCKVTSGVVQCDQTMPGSPPACLPPNGRLTYNGTHYLCICERGSSGSQCEVPPSLSQAEPPSNSEILGVQAVQDSGHSTDHGEALVLDEDVTTYWEGDSSANEFIVFDLQASLHVSGIAIKIPGDSTTAPHECKLDISLGNANGPWGTALDFQPEHLYRWQYFSVPASSSTRYVRVYFQNNRGDGSNIRVLEVEFFTPNLGIRSDLEPVRCMPPGGRLTYDGSNWVCICEDGWDGESCETPPSPSQPANFFAVSTGQDLVIPTFNPMSSVCALSHYKFFDIDNYNEYCECYVNVVDSNWVLSNRNYMTACICKAVCFEYK